MAIFRSKSRNRNMWLLPPDYIPVGRTLSTRELHGFVCIFVPVINKNGDWEGEYDTEAQYAKDEIALKQRDYPEESMSPEWIAGKLRAGNALRNGDIWEKPPLSVELANDEAEAQERLDVIRRKRTAVAKLEAKAQEGQAVVEPAAKRQVGRPRKTVAA